MAKRILCTVVLGLFVVTPEAHLQVRPPFAAWVISSLERVRPDDPPGSRRETELFAARGEYESFQVVVKAPSGGLHNVNIVVSDLVNPDGGQIDSSNFTLYREHYVRVTKASKISLGTNRSLGAGLYPDALIPFRASASAGSSPPTYVAFPIDLPAGTNQPFWVDLFVPPNTPSSGYKGRLTVTSDEGSAGIPVTCTVWNFQLPLRPSLRSSFAFWQKVGRQAVQELLRHKLMPQRVDPALQRDLIDHWGLTMTELGIWSGADQGACTMLPVPPPSTFQASASAHQPDLYLFNYTADEIQNCPHLFPSLKKWACNMHAAGIKNLVVMPPAQQLFDDNCGTGLPAVDIFVLLPLTYDRAAGLLAEARRRGSELWSYNALVQDSYSPKWLIDYDLIDYRIQPGFINQSLGLTGLLYWRIDRWSSDPWNVVDNMGAFGSANYPGEGMLVYPGAPAGVDGVTPSMRLKQLRDGVEDYEYIQILKQRGRGNWALDVVRTVASDWSHWTRDPAAFQSVRRQLGAEIHRLAAAGGAIKAQ